MSRFGRLLIGLVAAAVAVGAVVICLRNMPVEEPAIVPVVEAVPVEDPRDFGDPEEYVEPEPVEAAPSTQ